MPLSAKLALHRAASRCIALSAIAAVCRCSLLAAARVAATAARPLPVIVLVLSSALLTFSLAAAQRHGQEQGAWRSVGGDVRLDGPAAASVPALARRIAAQDGVEQALSAHIIENVPVDTGTIRIYVRLLVVDPAAFEQFLRATPLPAPPELGLLRSGSHPGAPVPALLRTDDVGSLALGLITGQATRPDLVVPWLSLLPAVLLVAAVAAVITVESSLRRRERLGQVLRAGNE